jgi:hypothetical protein
MMVAGTRPRCQSTFPTTYKAGEQRRHDSKGTSTAPNSCIKASHPQQSKACAAVCLTAASRYTQDKLCPA